MISSVHGRRLKGKGKGVLGATETREVRKEGGRDFNIPLVDVYNAKNNSLLAGVSPSLLSLHFSRTQIPLSVPFEIPATQAK